MNRLRVAAFRIRDLALVNEFVPTISIRHPVMRPVSVANPKHSPRSGFALLLTITLLSFLVLLLVSLASLTRVETSVAGNNQQLGMARQHALTSLNLALGQLQRFTGPDQRVTATANQTGAGAAPRWTGVWGNATPASDHTSSPRFLNWLVSGNEDVPLSVATATNNAGMITSAAASPAFRPADMPPLTGATAQSDLQANSHPWRLLVGAGSSEEVSGYVAAPLMELAAPTSAVPGLSSSGSTPTTIGRYAWWIGDEGVKARVNLAEPEERITSTDDATLRLRYRVPGRTGVEAMIDAPATLASAGVPGGTALREDLLRVVSGGQLRLPLEGAAFPEAFLKTRFHDLTTRSQGLIADTLRGGLRRDLTAAFAPGTTDATEPTGPIWRAGSADGPPWQVLRSYYQLADLPRDGSDAVTPRSPTSDGQHGLSPVVALWQWYVEATLVELGGNEYRLELRHYPALVLWNPHNVTLRDETYHGTYAFGAPTNAAVVFFARVTAVNDGPAIAEAAHVGSPYFHYVNGSPRGGSQGSDAHFQFTVQSGALPPGHAYVYTMSSDVDLSWPSATATIDADSGQLVQLTRGWHGAGSHAVVVRPNATFTLDPSTDYLVSFWAGGAGNATRNMPTWNAALPDLVANDAHVAGHDRFFLRIGDANGEIVQTILRNNSYLSTRNAAATLLNQSSGQPAQTGPFGYYGQKWALKTSADTVLPNLSDSSNRRVAWLAHYNPRAPLSTRSPYDLQSPGGSGYFNTNPIYNRATVKSGGGGVPIEFSVNFSGASSEGRAYVAMSQNFWEGSDAPQAVLFDVPRPEARPLSLGALQHANAYRLDDEGWAANYAPSYPIGNSLADPRVGLSAASLEWPASTTLPGGGSTYDHSYLLNRALWDGYFFSGVPHGPANAPIDFPLENNRHVPLERDDPASRHAALRNAETAAAHLLISGAFNVNSTSAQAWRALLASFNHAPVGATPGQAGRSPYPRFAYPVDDAETLSASSGAAALSAAYRGYRFLTSAQIETLADEIVRQVCARGPFVSLADFVNRALTDNPATSDVDERLRGALAQALADAGVNRAFDDSPTAQLPGVGNAAYAALPSPASHNGPTTENLPGWISQADLLQSLGPVLSARSDTFIIRAYGETVNPLLAPSDAGYVQGRAWCEAVVQRLPDFVNPAHAPETLLSAQPDSAARTENLNFGRRYHVVSFRWLTPDDL